MNEKIVIITGSNSGIGKAAAKRFARDGYRVIMACRNIEKSKRAREEIKQASKSEKVDLMKLDVSSFESIRSFCSEYRTRFQELDILIHNAAFFNHGEKEFQLSPDNIELTWSTNTFGPLLMTYLLKDHLSRSDDPRILNASTSNIKHFFDPKRKIELDNLHGELKDRKKYDVYKMYGDSKMASLMLTFKLAEEFRSDDIKVNAVMIPNIRQEKESLKKFRTSYYRMIARFQNIIARSPERMAETYYYICTSEEFREVTGKLVNIDKEIMHRTNLPLGKGSLALIKELMGSLSYPHYAENREMIERVWEISLRETKAFAV